MGTGATPPSVVTRTEPATVVRPVSSHPTTLALAPYVVAVVIVVGIIVLLALSKITETAGVGLLGVIVGGHLVAHLNP